MITMDNKRFTLRTAAHEDAERIADILLMSRKHFLAFAPLAHTDDEVRAWVRKTLLPEESVTVAVVNGIIEGFIATSQAHNICWINQLYLLPARIRFGLGSALLAHAIAAIPAPVRLYTFQENWPARKFYERHGFLPLAFSDGASNEEKCPDILYELA
ncbi:MAG: ribosomal protein S18 acetylase RimI-like enzyme [Candidatus Azotimanducaceae bacterium]|jgi:ribosomal protein S18 acetylase RimI-like enzyme